MLSENAMVTVPEVVLQDLIWNLELNFAGVENLSPSIEAALSQAKELQNYLMSSGSWTDEDDVFLFDNVVYVDFKSRIWI